MIHLHAPLISPTQSETDMALLLVYYLATAAQGLFSLLYFSYHHHGSFLSSPTLSSLELLCSFSLIDFLLAFSLACPLGHICSFSKADTCGVGEEELVSCFLCIGHAVPGALL